MYIPSFPTYLSVYILTISECISSCSRPEVGSNIVQITRATFFVNVFIKMAAGSHFGCPKIIFDRISYHFRSITQFFIFVNFFSQNGHWRPFWISGHFRSITNFFLNVWQNGRCRPFWMSDIHFRSHFCSFQIDTELFFSAAILDVRKSLSIAFLAISDRSAILGVRNSFLDISDRYGYFYIFGFFLWQNGRQNGGHFELDDNVNYRTRPRYLVWVMHVSSLKNVV